MGRYTYPANWIAQQILKGTRNPRIVARYLRVLLKENHANSVAAGTTVHPMPNVCFSQEAEHPTQESEDSKSGDEHVSEGDFEDSEA